MCGIAGVIDKKRGNIEKSFVSRMLDTINHRGPDSRGVYVEDKIGLGHCRLSILDVSDMGRQPMISHDEKYVIVFNGEVYNYKEIKAKLIKKGVSFSTGTDTEVILEAYRYYGSKCTELFNGMWAFAIYDREKDEIFMSRDRFGVKPFYILDREDTFVFASEIKEILEVYPEEKIMDMITVARYLKGIQEDADERTFYKNIKNFPKSNNLIYNLKTNEYTYQEYWHLDVDKCKKKYTGKNPYTTFLELFKDSLRLRLRSDVPIGTSLSGGLDSSAIVGVIKKEFGKSPDSFSSIYDDPSCNEREFIECMNKAARLKSHFIYPDKEGDIIEKIKEQILFHDGPCESASPLNGFYVYREAHGKVKVMLDGQGADELFGGYIFLYGSMIQELLEKGQKNKARWLLCRYRTIWEKQAKDFNFSKFEAFGLGGYKQFISNEGKKNIEVRGDKALKFNLPDEDIRVGEKVPRGVNGLNEALYRKLMYEMLPRILHDVDRNSMAHSIEVRLPFLDYRIVEFAFSLSSELKIHGGWSKYVVRKALAKYLPRKILIRKNKMGFPAPFERWICDERYKDEIRKYIDKASRRNFYNAEILKKYYKEQILGKANRSDFLYRVMSLEMWIEDSQIIVEA